MAGFRRLEEKFKKPHPALEGFVEPHPTMNWLIQSFFKLHRRREFKEGNPRPLKYSEMSDLARHVLKLPESLLGLYFRVMETTDDEVLEYLFKRNADKLRSSETQKQRGRKNE